jgi:hypothetical protein
MRVVVENALTGSQDFVLDVWPSDTVASIKEVVCQRLMIDPAMTMLVCRGKPMQDYHTIAQCGIQEDEKIQLMLNFQGGM